jgi:ketosteroid isomerase-like protein
MVTNINVVNETGGNMKFNQAKIVLCMGLAVASTAFASDGPTAVMRSYFDDLATGNFKHLGELLSENVIWHQPGKGLLSKNYVGKKEVFDLFGKFMEISQGTFKIDAVHAIMANVNLATATLHFVASRGAQKISMDGVDLMRIEKGQIQEVWLFSGDQDAEDAFWSQ